MKFGFKQIALSSALAAVIAPASLAQSADNPFNRGRYTAVTERSQADYDAQPIRAGAFEILSSLGAAAKFNDNVFATDDLTQSDTILSFTPEIQARSTWSSHALSAGLSLDHNEHLEQDSETATDYRGFIDGRIDVQRSFQLTGRLNAAHITEPRYEPGNAGVDPTQYNRFGYEAGAIFHTDRVQLRGAAGINSDDFEGVNGFRDVRETYFTGRGSYAVSPDVSLFVQGRTADQKYDDPGTVLNPSRDGTRTSYEVGANFELQAPLRGEIAVGNVSEDKDSRPDLDGLSLSAQLEWFPTQLTTVTFRGNSSVFDPGLAASASALTTVFGARVDHELYRNVILFGDASFGSYDYEGINRQDDFSDFSFGAAYKLNRHARLEADYRIHNTESSGTPGDLDPLRIDVSQNVFSVGIRVYP